jgi:hypothetical protein
MNESLIAQLEENIKRLDAIVNALTPLRDVLTAGEPEHADVDARLRRAQADRTDISFELAHVRAMSRPVPPLSEAERAAMRRELEILDSQLRDVQSVQAWLRFADAVIDVAGRQRAMIRANVAAA